MSVTDCDRMARIRAVAETVADNLDRGSGWYTEYMETLDFGNSWSIVESDLQMLMICYQDRLDGSYFGKGWGTVDRKRFVSLLADIVYGKTDKEYAPRDERNIYLYRFEAEHDADVSGVAEELAEAGASVLKTGADFAGSTGYALFTLKDAVVKAFEGKMGKLRNFRIWGKDQQK